MTSLTKRRPTVSSVIAVMALAVAMSGTAVAATSAANGDNLIKKNTLSGNRLRNHTVTGKQINLKKLGTVPVAARANSLPKLKWHPLTLQNGWTLYSNFYGAPAYTKDAEGFVHFRGAIDGSSSTSDTFASLPAGFRPITQGIWLRPPSTNGDSVPHLVDIFVSGGGGMTAEPDGTANKTFVSLEGVNFYVG
ncbi:MAG: hypothetical protein JO222_06680 [Frankiales bacterium]|nr:hypothetical protein [Frankiales bacterium]